MKLFRKISGFRVAFFLILLAGSGKCIYAQSSAPKDSLEGERLFSLAQNDTSLDRQVLLYRQASRHFRSANLPRRWWACMDHICWNFFKLQRDAETFAWIDTAVSEIWWPEDARTATVYANRGYYLKQVKDFYPAKKDYNYAYSLIQQHDTLTCVHGFTIIKTLANLYTQFGDYEKARILLETALEYCEGYANPSKNAEIISDLGTVYRFEGNPEKAINLYSRGLNIDGITTDTRGLLLLNKAEALHLLNQHNEALPLAIQALAELQKSDTPNVRYIEGAEAVLGAIYEKQGKRTDALRHFHNAIDLGKNTFGETPRRETGKIYQALGEMALDEGNYPQAEKYFADAAQSVLPDLDSRLLENPRMIADNVLMSGLEGLGATAWESYQKTGDKTTLQKAYTRYAQAIRVQNVLRESFSYESSSLKLQEESILRNEYAIAAAFELHRLTGEPSWLDSAFSLFEKSKSVVLKESLSELEAGKASVIPQPLLNRRNDLETARILFEKQIFEEKQLGDSADQKMIGLWENRLSQVRFSLDSVESYLKSQYANWYQLKNLTSRHHISEVQPWLAGKNAQMIQYFWGESSLYILAIDAKGIRSHTLSLGEANLAVKIDSLRLLLGDYQQTENEALAAQYYNAYTHLAHQLYQLLLAPVLPDHKQKPTKPGKLIIIPDGLLGYIPFDVLLSAPAQGKNGFRTLDYVLNDYIVSYGYSAGLSMIQKPPRETFSSMLGGYAPSYGEGWFAEARRSFRLNDLRAYNNLKYNQPEVEKIIEMMGGDAFMGNEATEAAFRSSAGRYRILHLSMHGFTNEEEPLYSGLVFSYGNGIEPISDQKSSRSQAAEPFSLSEKNTDIGENDGFLHTYEIFTLNLRAEMAVLSACKTGLGKLIRGEGIMSLARAFRAAGCPSVVMSLWEADDQSTREIMEKFYANLKEGQAKDEALHNAKIDYIQSAASNRINPLYWSTFVMIGDDSPVFGEDYTWIFFLLGGSLILGIMALAIFLNRRKPQEHI